MIIHARQGTKMFQYCTRPVGRVTYNFHSSCKHMHSSLKLYCNKENRGGGGGGGGGGSVSFITASHTLTKRVLHSILSLMLRLSRLLSALSAGDILAELQPSRRKFNNDSDTFCQTYFIDENAL